MVAGCSATDGYDWFIPAYAPYADDPEFDEEFVDDSVGVDGKILDSSASSFLSTSVPKWMPEQGPHFSRNWENRLLVWPEHKFAFCWIDKNAGTQFNSLMNYLNNVGHTKYEPWRKSSIELHKDLSIGDITKENGWRTAIFLRSPEERLISAFLSKCKEWEDHGNSCMGTKRVDQRNKLIAKFENMVRSKLPQYMKIYHKMGSYNAHYDPQSSFCGGRSLDTYDFVGHLTGEPRDVHEQVTKMLKSAAMVPEDHSVWNFLPEVFPAERREGHQADAFHQLASFYRSPQVYAKVVEAYAEDYEKLGFKKAQYVR